VANYDIGDGIGDDRLVSWQPVDFLGVPYEIRTRVTAVKGRYMPSRWAPASPSNIGHSNELIPDNPVASGTVYAVGLPHHGFEGTAMPRKARDERLDTRTVRLKLTPRAEPYWRNIQEGRALGYRRLAGGKAGTWIARHYDQGEGRKYCALGSADDTMDADGASTLTFSQAQDRPRLVPGDRAQCWPRDGTDQRQAGGGCLR
jgi:hypothetical protein